MELVGMQQVVEVVVKLLIHLMLFWFRGLVMRLQLVMEEELMQAVESLHLLED